MNVFFIRKFFTSRLLIVHLLEFYWIFTNVKTKTDNFWNYIEMEWTALEWFYSENSIFYQPTDSFVPIRVWLQLFDGAQTLFNLSFNEWFVFMAFT